MTPVRHCSRIGLRGSDIPMDSPTKLVLLPAVDVVDGKAEGLALDLNQSRWIEGFETKVVGQTTGPNGEGYEVIAGSEIVVITAGLPRKPGMSRMDLIETNAKIMRAVAENIAKHAPGAVIINVANPLDEMTALAQIVTGFPYARVIGQAGMLDTALERIAHHREKSHALQIALRSALVYPCTVLVIALVVMALLLSFVVPAFQTIFASFGAELPALTRGVIALSEAWQTGGWWVLLALVGLVWAAHRYIRQHLRWQYWRDAALLRLPVAGHLIRHACLARWTRTLTTLFAAGVTLTDALEAVQGVTGNLRYAHATQSVQTQLMRGLSLAQALAQEEDLFEPLVVQMCAVGEESGALEHMLDKTALHYERDVETTVARMATLLEPLIMVVLGVLIGGMVMALYLPIFQLGQVV